jgi:hypothetical protein
MIYTSNCRNMWNPLYGIKRNISSSEFGWLFSVRLITRGIKSKSRYKQNWINHLERMDNTRLPKHALNYKHRERRDRRRPRKRWQRVDAATGQIT